MSIGTADEDTVRGFVRLPSTETVSSVVAASGVFDVPVSWAYAVGLVDSNAVARATITADANGVIAFGA